MIKRLQYTITLVITSALALQSSADELSDLVAEGAKVEKLADGFKGEPR